MAMPEIVNIRGRPLATGIRSICVVESCET